jgi:cytochrome c oxidase subunit IV
LYIMAIPERLRVGWAVPCGEEILKYAMAMEFSLPFWAVYLLFGINEGLYEFFRSAKNLRWRLFIAGPLIHWGLGIAYFYIPSSLGLVIAIFMHIVWNNLIILRRNHYKNSSN